VQVNLAPGDHNNNRVTKRLTFVTAREHYSLPPVASAIAKDCYILVVLFIFTHRFFDVPEPILRNFSTQRGMF